MKKIIIAIVLFFIFNFIIFSQEKYNFEKKNYISLNKDTLFYRFLKPKNFDGNKKYPLVIFLHGAGERGNDNSKQLRNSVKIFAEKQDKYPCFVFVPQCPEKKRWVEVSWQLKKHKQAKISEPLQLTFEVLEKLLKDKNIDKNRVYLTGLSMGGFGTWDFLSRFPEIFACGVPVCGGGDEEKASLIKNIPIWAFHGTKDKVVKVERSRNMINAIKKFTENKCKYTEYKNLGHNCWTKTYNNDLLLEWIFSQKK